MFGKTKDLAGQSSYHQVEIDTPTSTVSPAETTILPPVPASSMSSGGPNPNELERLRDILYGHQARLMERRFSELDNRLESVRQQLTDMFNERVDVCDVKSVDILG